MITCFIIVQDTSALKQEMAVVLKLTPCLLVSKFDFPFAFLFIPVAPDDLCVESHILAEIERLTNFIEVFPDVWTIGEETWPVCVL